VGDRSVLDFITGNKPLTCGQAIVSAPAMGHRPISHRLDLPERNDRVERGLTRKRTMALLLGTVGLYGIIAYSLSHRTREIGVRMALGAQRRDVTSLVLGEGMLVILIGLAIGLAGSLVLTIFLSSLLVGVTATDPLTFVGVAVLSALVAIAACYIPAPAPYGSIRWPFVALLPPAKTRIAQRPDQCHIHRAIS
jgi:predicted lysophospholipase L1 biosynthesis ABC-type transport system permease subunit